MAADGALRKALTLGERPDDVLPSLALALIRRVSRIDSPVEFGTRKLENPAADASLQTSLGQAWLMAWRRRTVGGQRFAAALTHVPRYPAARLGQARIAAQAGKIDDALTIADEVLAADPGWPRRMRSRRSCCCCRASRAEASQSLEKAIAIDANEVPVRAALASLRMDDREYERAQVLLDAVKPHARRSAFDLPASLLALRRGDLQKARDEVNKVLGQAPDSVPNLIAGRRDRVEVECPGAGGGLTSQVRCDQARRHRCLDGCSRRPTCVRGGRPRQLNCCSRCCKATSPRTPGWRSLLARHTLPAAMSRAPPNCSRSPNRTSSAAPARFRLGQIALAQGDFDRGVDELQAASAIRRPAPRC